MAERTISRTGTRKPIGEILLEGAFVKPEELQAALEVSRRAGKKVGQVLLEQRSISPETLATVLSFQLGIPVVDLKQFKIQPEALALISDDVARDNSILPLSVDGDLLTVAMDDPENLGLVDTLSVMARKRIKPVIALHGGIREAVNTHYKMTSKIQEQIAQVVKEQASPRRPAEAAQPAAEPAIAPEAISQAPVVRAVEMVITQAVKDRASDIHIEPQEDGLRVRYRIDGILHDVVTLPMGVHSALLSRIKVMANMNIAERRRPQDGQFTMKVGEKQIDFRVATAETKHGEMTVLRVLDKAISLYPLSDLGISASALEIYRRAVQSAFGMVIISGPTGSGKTTTLYATLGELDPKERNIMTIEDPIEYEFKSINQIQVNRQADITFAAGLRAIMRLDPDIVLVGEIRDAETAKVAINAALTGHLVLTSIHANDAVGAVIRLIDLGVEPFLVTSGVLATVSQRLVRKVCPYCQTIGPVSPAEVAAYQQEMNEVRTDFIFGRGCNFCSHTGFLGRIGVYEVLPLTEQVRQLIAREAPSAEIKAAALKEGMVTMRRDGMLKAKSGITTPAEVIRNVYTLG
ncbi:MAG: Flp pilus assembly complex ATPase component TadA [Chloroflexi bacterium]|nr:Flp pilus assembly complex ATPase component TadA [Chloroflexota bacterium]